MTTLTVGTGLEYTTLSAAVAATQPGDTIALQAGTYTNDFPGLINSLTIEGVGGIAKLVATGQPANGKAILDVAGNTTLRNLDISGVTVPDTNGAAIRYESGNLVIENTAIHGNQDGILGASDSTGSITIDRSEIYGNGTSAGNTHNIYIGNIAQFTLTNSYIHDANTGHEVKSRAESNTITNNRIQDNSSTASYEIDLPNGGNATISGNTIQKSADSGNHVSIAYGEEGSTHAGTTVSITNNTIISDQSGAYVVWDTTGAPITASGNTTYNVNRIDKSGYVSSSGFTATGTRPTLDTWSPIDQSPGSSTPTPTTTSISTPTSTPIPTSMPTPTPPADTTAPSLTVTQSTSGLSNHATDTISGTVSDSGSDVANVEIYDLTAGRFVDLGSASLGNGGFSFEASDLADGSHTFVAVATDNSGNATQAMLAGADLTVDTIAPSLTATQKISGTTTQTGNTLSGTISDSGSGIAAVEIFLTSAGTTTDLGSATLDGGNWSYTVSNLAPGTYTFAATATDKAGNATARLSTGLSETVAAPTPSIQPGLQSVSQVSTGLLFRGTAQAGSSIVLNDTVSGKSHVVGAAVTRSDGTWSITTGTINFQAVNTLTTRVAGSVTSTSPTMTLSSTAADTLSGHAGKADLFAFVPGFGRDIIRGFETTAAVGAAHDVIDLAGTNYRSFQQLQPQISGASSALIHVSGSDTFTLSGVSANSLQASDFRFS